jgi:hypothetical protein
MTIREGINEMRCIVANTMFNLCRDGIQEVREDEHLKANLMKDKIAYRESVGDVGPSTNISGSSTRWGDIGSPHRYTNVTDPSSS